MFGAVDRVAIIGSEILETRYGLAMKRAGIATASGAKDAAARVDFIASQGNWGWLNELGLQRISELYRWSPFCAA